VLQRELARGQIALQHVRITEDLLRRRAAPHGRPADERLAPATVQSQSRGGL
jgi:hypothetical protein